MDAQIIVYNSLQLNGFPLLYRRCDDLTFWSDFYRFNNGYWKIIDWIYYWSKQLQFLATDSILGAFEKIQGQLSASIGAAITALTGDVVATGPGQLMATIQPNVVDNC